MIKKIAAAVGFAALLSAITQANAAPCSSPYAKGDVFASVGGSTVDVFTPTGTLVCSLFDASLGSFATGSGFDKSGNFLVTNFDAGSVSKFNNSGGLVAKFFMTSTNGTESVDIVSKGPFAGSTFVGGPTIPVIDQFDTASGTFLKRYVVQAGNGVTHGTDWTDMALDGHTILYTGEGTAIQTFDLSTSTQGPDFTTAATEAALDRVFAFRVIPEGAMAGDVLISNTIDAVLLDSSGNIVKSYTLPGNGGGEDFALNLDPNGTDFWTANTGGEVWEVNIATGAIDEQWNTGSSSTFGLSVFGEITSGGGGGPTVPEPSTWIMLLVGFAGVGYAEWRRRDGRATTLAA